MQTADRLLLAALLLFGVLVVLNRAEPAQTLPLVKADIPYCFTVRNPPLIGTHPTAKDPHPRMPDVA